mgnify:CR=1 FL=1
MAGYVVLQAANGADAVRVAAEIDAPIDLILSDVVMPGVRGATAVADVRRNHPKARALFMTGYADARSLADLRDPLLQKPFTPRDLLVRVREVLDSPASALDGS